MGARPITGNQVQESRSNKQNPSMCCIFHKLCTVYG